MTVHQRDAISTPAKDEKTELREKDRDERNLGERYGREATGEENDPESKETGYKGASNAGEDLTSGDG
jgi:hypothetical protein